MGLVRILLVVDGLVRIPLGESIIGQNSFGSGWDWSEFLWEQLSFGKFGKEKREVIAVCSY